MNPESEALSSTKLIAAASETLLERGYQRARLKDWPSEHTRLFEDSYGIVSIVVYNTWRDLLQSWPDAQAALVELISQHVSRAEAKAWDGYLVLLTPAILGPDQQVDAAAIRYDTNRVRKLLATGGELNTLSDVERVLLPLLPLPDLRVEERESVLELLPGLLGRRGIPESTVRVLIEAFNEQLPLVERLHASRSTK